MTPSNELYTKTVDLLKRGETSQARNILQRALKDNPKDEKAWMLYVGTLSTDEERIQALNWCLKFNPDSAVAKEALAKLQPQPTGPQTSIPPTRAYDPGATDGGQETKQRSSGLVIAAILISVIVVCIVITSITNLLDTPLFALGETYKASTYGVTDSEQAALVLENHSAYFIGSIVLTRSQDGKVYEFEGLKHEEVGVYSIEPGGYDLQVNYKSFEGEFIPSGEIYIASTVTAHFNVRSERAVIFHLEGGGMNTSALGFVSPELVGK